MAAINDVMPMFALYPDLRCPPQSFTLHSHGE